MTDDGIVLIEVAPGISLESDVLERIGFPVRVSSELKQMDSRLFRDEPMGLLAGFRARLPRRPPKLRTQDDTWLKT
jgi:acyl CoA:acetate/3-ketoacid CoA transferase